MEVKDFLTYIENSTPEVAKRLNSPMIDRLSDRVETVKRDKEIGEMYMLYEEHIEEALDNGREEGEKHMALKLYKKNLITAEQAAEELGITKDEFLKLVK